MGKNIYYVVLGKDKIAIRNIVDEDISFLDGRTKISISFFDSSINKYGLLMSAFEEEVCDIKVFALITSIIKGVEVYKQYTFKGLKIDVVCGTVSPNRDDLNIKVDLCLVEKER